jgi:hypothetical protein
MGMKKLKLGLVFMGALTMATGLGASLSGCFGGCDLRDIPLTIPFGQNISINASVLAPFVSGQQFTNAEIPLGNPDSCQIEGIDDLLGLIDNAGAGVIRSIIQIESITVDSITLEANNSADGNFDFISNMRVEISATGGTSGDRTFVLATNAIGGDELTLVAQNEIDLWGLLQDGFDCISGKVIISGDVPSEDVVFDGTLHITIHPVISLRPTG